MWKNHVGLQKKIVFRVHDYYYLFYLYIDHFNLCIHGCQTLEEENKVLKAKLREVEKNLKVSISNNVTRQFMFINWVENGNWSA